MYMASTASTKPDAVLPMPAPAPIDPLDVFLALQRKLFDIDDDRPAESSSLPARYFVPPVIAANHETMPALFDFASRTQTGFLSDENVAALYVAVRLFGSDWREYGPPIKNRVWIESVDEYRLRSEHGRTRPCPAEMLEISRVFRIFLRPDSAALQLHKQTLAGFVGESRGFVGEAFNSESKSDSYRIALFMYACRLSNEISDTTRQRFVTFVRQNSFIRRADATRLARMIERDPNADRESVRVAIRCFRLAGK